MYIERLKLFHFRNLTDQVIDFPKGVTLILGDNGQGKTNLVEAISLLATTKSFRTSNQRELIRWGETEGSVFADINTSLGIQTLGITLQGNSRAALVNNEASPMADFVGRLVCVSFSPTDISLVKGQPLTRRRFLDKHLVDLTPHLIRHLVAYQRALRSRNVLLKGQNIDIDKLFPWERILAEEGALILNARLKFVEKLEHRTAAIIKEFCTREEITLGLKSFDKDSVEIKAEDLLLRFEREREREIAHRSTLVGPHRDDLMIALNGKDSRAFASQGQSRSIVLALKLAVIELLEEEREDAPIVLLDDVDSELDRTRRRALFLHVFNKSRQVFITGTEARIESEEIKVSPHILSIQNGTISRYEEA